ncbi:hypothetical protein [Rhizobium rhizogenes]|uniref:hypothetical protein n=1 Tax=Rhizobium rhizogenes TaxID=359 RepID=UPI0015741BB7|nr:hypothetical protein [Rhizobium rhizogenes]
MTMHDSGRNEGHKFLSEAWVDTYRQVASKAQFVREILAARGVKIGSGSALSRFLKQADILSQAWDEQREVGPKVLFEAAHVNKLADAITALSDEPGIQEALKRIAGSVMQPDDRTLSQGKDALWELSLLADFRKAGLKSRPAEPDILVDYGAGDYPVACKKIWSEAGVPSQVRKGAKQLRKFQNQGIIALNLDDLTPVGHVIFDRDRKGASEFLNSFNHAFKERHRGVLEKAIVDKKCDGFLISTSAATVLRNEAQPFNLMTQRLMWNMSGATAQSAKRFHDFFAAQKI